MARSRAASARARPDRRSEEGQRTTPTAGVGPRLRRVLALALVRIADEVCLQMHLLEPGLRPRAAASGRRRADCARSRRQLIGVAGIAAERIRALGCPAETRARSGARAAPAAQPRGLRDAEFDAAWSCSPSSRPRGRRLDLVDRPRRDPPAAGRRRGGRPASRRGGQGTRTTGPRV